MPLCHACSGITIEKLARKGLYEHHKSIRHLSESAKSCDLCDLLHDALHGFGIKGQICLSMNYDYIYEAKDIHFYIDGKPIPGRLELCVEQGRDGVLRELGDELGIDVSRIPRLPSSSADSEECWEFLRRKLNMCLNNHPNCRNDMFGSRIPKSFQPKLPTRVIDVGCRGDEILRLREQPRNGESFHGRYTTLSHCWGPPSKRPLTTTSRNLKQHLKAIPVNKLGKTFQDAVKITRELGIQYLWIDSLCILQDEDDTSDWEREAGKMGLIYEQSYLTIAATGAADGTEGCFIPREPPRVIEIPLRSSKSSKSRVLLKSSSQRLGFSMERRFDEPPLGPLQNRAWITQEWVLSPRIIHYCRGQMVWMCDSESMAEDGQRYRAHAVGAYRDAAMSRAANAYSSWNWLVQAYSQRGMTRITDKLVALQGLANKIEMDCDDRYVSGMWVSRLPYQLLWQRTLEEPKLLRPRALRELGIPSWSWGSTMGSISTASCSGNDDLVCTSVGVDFHQKLKIRSFCLEMSRERVLSIHVFPSGQTRVDDGFGDFIGSLVFDDGTTSSWENPESGGILEGPCYVVPMVDHSFHLESLIVSPATDEPNCFRRVGVVSLHEPGRRAALDYLRTKEQQDIYLI